MSLVHRKARPLTRDSVSLRDDRLFIIACDDTYAPKQYFEFFQIQRVKVHVAATEDGTCSAADVLARLLQYEHDPDDELWLLLDTDHYTQGTHLASFTQAISEAKRQGVKVALSRPCFEVWLLLHHVEETEIQALSNAKSVANALRTAQGSYDKTALNKGDYPVSSVVDACRRSKRLDDTVGGGDIPTGNVSRVYRVWDSIVAKALPSQLPAPLQALRR